MIVSNYTIAVETGLIKLPQCVQPLGLARYVITHFRVKDL
jgi:hypothetical protein